ncbi:hypothetical protein KDA23_07290 [Candidatus Saccharibacteria bacterium]|nr:hypothetical protein [Candidatus Saccharibacteria bacterium]
MLLHPTIVFGLLLVGVLLVGSTLRTLALNYVVTAKVSAPLLSSGATITSPQPGQKFSHKTISVTGQCPSDSYINLYRNGMFSGTAVCIDNGYEIQTDLFEGLNDLKVQAYNSTDDAGPQTPIVQVTYTLSSTGGGSTGGGTDHYTPPTSGDTTLDEATNPLLLWSDYHFNVFSTQQPFQWTLRFQSGLPPYATHVVWGDGQHSYFKVQNHNSFTIIHSYSEPGYYPIVVTASDARGRTVSLQLAALIKLPGASGTIGSITNPTPPQGSTDNSGIGRWMWLAWPTYLVVSLMAASFWLGERREILQLVKGANTSHNRERTRRRHP